MTLYWALLITAVVAALFPGRLRNSQKAYVWMAFGVALALFLGLRHKTGGDWYSYEYSFWYHGALPFSALVDNIRDPGYYWTGWLLYRSGASIHALNLMCAALLSWGLIKFCRPLASGWLGVVAAVPYLLIVVGMGYTRQSAAIGLVLVALAHVNAGSVRHYVIFVLLAALMHRTALVMLPFAVFAISGSRVFAAFALGAITAIAGEVLLAPEIERLWNSYVESSYSQAADGAPVRVAMNALAAIVFLIFRKHISQNDRALRLWTALSIAALACVPLLGFSLTAVDRLALYLLPLQVYIAGSLAAVPVGRFLKTGAALSVVLSYGAVLFVWLTFAHHAGHWIPYESILWSGW